MIKPAVYFTDLHCNKYNQFSEHHDRLKDCLKVIDDVFRLAVKSNSDTILFGGDLGDLPKWIYIEVIDEICTRLSKWFKKCPNITIYAISGNHDHNKKNFWDKPAKTLLNVFATAFSERGTYNTLLNLFPGRFILIDNGVADLGDNCYVAGIPYYEHKTCFDQALDAMHGVIDPVGKRAKVTLLIHQTPEGIYNKHIKAETSPSDPRYEAFDMILCGHIHKPQKLSPKFIIGGNPLHRDLGDIGDVKGIYLLDLTDPVNTIEFISREGRYPAFVRMKQEKITEEMQQTSFVIPTSDTKKVVIEGSADPTEFGVGMMPKDLLTNFWKQAGGADERLLKVGLSLID